MKCPLFAMFDKRVQVGEETELCECLNAECAWWVNDETICLMMSEAISLHRLAGALDSLSRRSPPAPSAR